MLAEDGRCKTLDVNADGYVRAEAATCLILVLAREVTNNRAGVAVLAGTAVNQDGR